MQLLLPKDAALYLLNLYNAPHVLKRHPNVASRMYCKLIPIPSNYIIPRNILRVILWFVMNLQQHGRYKWVTNDYMGRSLTCIYDCYRQANNKTIDNGENKLTNVNEVKLLYIL